MEEYTRTRVNDVGYIIYKGTIFICARDFCDSLKVHKPSVESIIESLETSLKDLGEDILK